MKGFWTWALEYHTLIPFWGDLLLKGNHYEIKLYAFFSLVTSKLQSPGTAHVQQSGFGQGKDLV